MPDAPRPFALPRERPGEHPPTISSLRSPQLALGLFDRLELRLEGAVQIENMGAVHSLAERRRRARRGGIFVLDQSMPPDTIMRLESRPGWHFEGTIRFPGMRGTHIPRLYHFVCDLTLNFSRFVNQAGRSEDWSAPANFSVTEEPSSSTKRMTYNGNDNVVHGTAFERLTQPGMVAAALDAYISGVREHVREDLLNLTGASDWSVHTEVVRQAEIYWEFYTQRAKADAAYWGRQIDLGVAHGSVTRYEDDLVSYAAKLGNGIHLSTYAKTPTRVRFEVQYSTAISRSARAAGITPVIRLLNARVNAFNRLGRAISPLCEDLSEHTVPRSLLARILGSIHAACQENTNLFRAVLDVLLDRSSVGPNDTLPDDVIQRLVSQRVLIASTSRRTNRYRAAPEVEWVLQQLRTSFPPHKVQGWASNSSFDPS